MPDGDSAERFWIRVWISLSVFLAFRHGEFHFPTLPAETLYFRAQMSERLEAWLDSHLSGIK